MIVTTILNPFSICVLPGCCGRTAACQVSSLDLLCVCRQNHGSAGDAPQQLCSEQPPLHRRLSNGPWTAGGSRDVGLLEQQLQCEDETSTTEYHTDGNRLEEAQEPETLAQETIIENLNPEEAARLSKVRNIGIAVGHNE